MSIKAYMRRIIDGTIKRRRPGSYAIYSLCRRVVQAYENNDVDMRTNGEYWLQGRFAGAENVVAIDVGANQGEWVSGLLKRIGKCKVYCFEPVPTTFSQLKNNVNDVRAELINAALSDKPGALTIHSSLDNSHVSSVYNVELYDPEARVETVDVAAMTGDQVMQRYGLAHLDVLKVDAEGHDLDVLMGFRASLDEGAIDFIQFEYNGFTLFARKTLRDFFDLLEDKYLVCRLLPHGLEACGYSTVLDDFRQTNWVAVRLPLVDGEFVRRFSVEPARGLPGIALRERLKDHPSTLAAIEKRGG